VQSTRLLFWWQLIAIALRKPNLLYDYLIALGVGEHFFKFRHEVKAQLQEQLKVLQHQESYQEKTSLQLEAIG
jgi:hypothetical protein